MVGVADGGTDGCADADRWSDRGEGIRQPPAVSHPTYATTVTHESHHKLLQHLQTQTNTWQMKPGTWHINDITHAIMKVGRAQSRLE